jgi:hypothetical protein
MLKCPFCHFDNEDGALFCEQCKSDLASAAPIVQAEALPLEAIPTAAPVVMEAIAEPLPAAPYEAIPISPAEAIPLQGEPLTAIPLAEERAPARQAPPVVETHPYRPPAAPAPTPASTPAPTPAASAPATPGATPAATPPAALPAGAQPRLLVLRGQKRNVEYPIYEGLNFIGRADEKPVDIDLEDQEPPDRIWCSRQHACLSFENNELSLEDLNSANGTYVNRTRIYPGQKRALAPNDIIQIGNVQLKVVV